MKDSCVGILGDDAVFLHVFLQDQRLVGVPSLRVHLPVWRHAHLVSLPHFLPKVSNCEEVDIESLFGANRPEGVLYQMFRNQFISYCLYQSKEPLQSLGLTDCLAVYSQIYRC